MQVSFRKTISGCFAERDLQLEVCMNLVKYKTSAWMSHVTRMHESCHIYKTSSCHIRRDSWTSLTWPIHVSNVTYSRLWCHADSPLAFHLQSYAVKCSLENGIPQDASSCRSLSAKQPLIIGLFCGANTWVTCASNARYRVAKTHRMPYLYMSFSAKEPYN